MGYGRQRVWGTIGFGIGALLAGYTIDLWSQGDIYKTYTPAFLMVLAFTCFDVICCKKLEVSYALSEENEECKTVNFTFNTVLLIGSSNSCAHSCLDRIHCKMTRDFILTFSLHVRCIFSLQLPLISGSTNILKDVFMLLKLKPIAIFLCFAALAGIFDSFMIYFLFW